MKPEISTGLTQKCPSGNPHQISNTEGRGQNVQFGGSGLNLSKVNRYPKYNCKQY